MTDSESSIWCPKCQSYRPRSAFGNNRANATGKQSYCNDCRAAYRSEHRERIASLDLEYQKKHRAEAVSRASRWRMDNAEKARAHGRAVYHRNKNRWKSDPEWREKKRQRDAVYRATHKAEIKAYQQKHLHEKPEVYAACSARRKTRKLGNGGTHTAADVKAQYDRQKGKCFWCGKKLKGEYHVDHVMPLSKGGSNNPENLVCACAECNLRKRDKHPMDFAGILF